MVVMAACILLMNLCLDSKHSDDKTSENKDNVKHNTTDNGRFRILFLIGLFFFYIAYCGFGANYGNYVSTYAVEELSFTKQKGAQVS